MVEKVVENAYNIALLQQIRVKCVELNTSIPKIEKALGYGNGAISCWKNAKRNAPMDRIVAIAEYLGVSVDDLVRPYENKKTPTVQTNDGLTDKQREFIDVIRELPDDIVSPLLSAAKDWLNNRKSADSPE